MDLLGTTTLFLVISLVLFMAWRKVEAKRKNLPPGPMPLPLIGNLLQLKASNVAGRLKKMSEKYGPVFTVYFGSDQVVVLYGYDVVKKILPFNPAMLLSCATANVISHILLGERFDYEDQEYRRIVRLLIESLRLESSIAGQLYNIFPRIMDHLPGPHQTFFTNLADVQAFVAQKIRNHEKTLDPSSGPRDFIDSFLFKMEQVRHRGANVEFAERISSFNALPLTPLPAKIHEEIDRVIGRERLPAMKDRLQMPYTEAALHEAQSSALNDPKQYKNPYQFDPAHFLDEKGEFKRNGADMPFSAGLGIGWVDIFRVDNWT
ncbi:hypothetical protein JD844_003860 [Phrynosoma platyrhinos]|uniref:Cytochrome P450 2E1 n=1 Tax=Phrynosoma platyrhinos TaxID=52577 RepID=A0ABQ7TDZ0_PHRPL|nr:hypothetical protein JD844_003860 [Phrynosoma platyrhinos]